MEVKKLDFGQPEDSYTFNHVIAIGEKANNMLSYLKLNLGSWFEDELLTIKEGHEDVRNLIAIVDNDNSLLFLLDFNTYKMTFQFSLFKLAKEPLSHCERGSFAMQFGTY